MVKIKQLSESEKLAIFEENKNDHLANIHRRLLDLIAKAQKESVEVHVSGGGDDDIVVRFTFQKEYESGGRTHYDYSSEYSTTRIPNSEDDLDNLKWGLESIQIEIEEAKRKRLEKEEQQVKRANALNKLTTEERKLLGLTY